MSKHEEKICERCGNSFECKYSNITNCECYAVQLDAEEREILNSQYTDCLCAGCLLSIKKEYHESKNY
jgi:hypothetical protein